MKEKTKKKLQKGKQWVKANAKELVALTCLGITTIWTINSVRNVIKDNKAAKQALENIDYGRDCTMKFIVDETGELLGEAKCTESFANDFIEMSSED